MSKSGFNNVRFNNPKTTPKKV